MFPLRDENPSVHVPWATYSIIAANIAVWALLQGFGTDPALPQSLCTHALIPGDLFGGAAGTVSPVSSELACRLDGQASVRTIFSSMFMHGGWFHIIGNLWFLWIFGDNVEDVMGPGRFLAFYLLSGLAAAGAQILTDPASAVPMVGASGAIGGVMGGYAMLFPKTRIHTLIFLGFFITTLSVPAFVMLGYWFALQLLQGVPSLGSSGGGVAFWAHIGGFVAGLVLVKLFQRRDYLSAHLAQPRRSAARHRLF
ncbi:MAG: rhomboid family intramembrane serine protease [Pseudomonadota bacterium]